MSARAISPRSAAEGKNESESASVSLAASRFAGDGDAEVVPHRLLFLSILLLTPLGQLLIDEIIQGTADLYPHGEPPFDGLVILLHHSMLTAR